MGVFNDKHFWQLQISEKLINNKGYNRILKIDL